MKNIIFIGLLLLIFSSCADHWDEHYREKDGSMEVSDKGILDYLKGREEYSEFVQLLKETGADSLLNTGKRYSVWAPRNENMPDLAEMSDSLKFLTMKNHITWGDYYNAGFKDGLSLRAYSGKQLRLHSSSEYAGGYTIEYIGITKTNMACRDGVVHEIEAVMELQPTLFDYLRGEEKYSLLREVVESFRDSVFDPKKSVIIDTNMYGQPVYDSVFNFVYQIYNQAPIHNDNNYYTLFLTDNERLQRVMDTYYDNYRLLNFGKEPDGKDSLVLKNWIAKSFIHPGLVENYGEVKRLVSVQGIPWRTDYEKVTPGIRKEFSNGYVYEMEELLVPYSFLMQSVTLPVFNIFKASPDNIVVDAECEEPFNVTKLKLNADGINYAEVTVELASGPAEVLPPLNFRMSVNTAVQNEGGSLVTQYFTPGEYIMSLRMMKTAKACQNFSVLVNDRYVGTVKFEKYTQVNKVINISNVGIVNIPMSDGVNPLKVTFENLGTGYSRTLAPVSVVLEKTSYNY